MQDLACQRVAGRLEEHAPVSRVCYRPGTIRVGWGGIAQMEGTTWRTGCPIAGARGRGTLSGGSHGPPHGDSRTVRRGASSGSPTVFARTRRDGEGRV